MSWFDRIFRFLLIALPFHVVLTVFFQFRLGIPGISLYKEVLVILMTVLLGMHFFRVRHVPKPDWLDWSILAYMAYLVLATIFNGLSVGHFVYGGRADFLFLWFFLVVRHGTPLLAATHATYVKMFLTSASVALVLSILVRFGVGESVLLWLGFSADLSNWQFGGSVPIYHGIPGANVRRFQGILDGPNPMAFFLILYITLLVQAFRHKKDWLFAIGLVCIFCLGLLFLTYSRSAFVGLFGAIVLSGLVWAGVLFRRHLRAVLVGICIFAGIGWFFYMYYQSTIDSIILRAGSSRGHFDRVMIGVHRFTQAPLGSGLATSGPAYRYVTPELKQAKTPEEEKKIEDQYIPESWYVQQLVEGGIIGFCLFLAITIGLLMGLARRNAPLFVAFAALAIMNVFLHSYESVYLSLLLFGFVGLFLPNITTWQYDELKAILLKKSNTPQS